MCVFQVQSFLSFLVELNSSSIFVANLFINLQCLGDEVKCPAVMLLELVEPVLDSEAFSFLIVADHSPLSILSFHSF